MPGLENAKCGLCENVLLIKNTFMAIVGNKESTAYEHLKGPFCHARVGGGMRAEYKERRNNFSLSTESCPLGRECKQCTDAPEILYVHKGCFGLVMRQWNSATTEPSERPLRKLLDFVWVCCSWKAPWHVPRCLSLEATPPPVPPASAMSGLGVEHFSNLPLELVHEVYEESYNSMVWRYGRILDLGDRAAAASPTDAATKVQLSKVLSWARGGQPVVSDELDHPPIVRLMMDGDGLRCIERLHRQHLYNQFASGGHSDRVAYALLGDEQAQTMYGLARLCFAKGVRHPDVWDMPVPPSLKPMVLHKEIGSINLRFKTTEWNKITGLTFLSLGTHTVGIHAHTAERPSATRTVDRLPWTSEGMTWEYFSVSTVKDHLATLPQRQGCQLDALTRTMTTTTTRAHAAPHRLIWGHDLSFRCRLNCSLETTALDEEGVEDVVHPNQVYHKLNSFGKDCQRLRSDYCARVPLADAVRVEVFNDSGGFCEGILVSDSSGHQHAAGSCRIGAVRPTIVTADPGHLRAVILREARRWPSSRTLKVHFSSDPPLVSEEDQGGETSRFTLEEMAFHGYRCDEGIVPTAIYLRQGQ
ncbi:hypothetical protein QBC34DRAFT_468634 [Podospora aff. communis PSN243]|uniref:Uncharacterized protein n=1 Tax=Podospora aff. communis PSN243 TaxID=3040156 RepID=A0AAV9GHQ3_9PEZI|nr:hypothetical protein QBC34DRAFT_468634 [Podospora aff. communis PSN243]